MFKKATQIIATEDEQDSQAPCALIAVAARCRHESTNHDPVFYQKF